MKSKYFYAVLFGVQLLISVVANAQPLQTARPEEVGISSAKAALFKQELTDRVNKGELPGAVVMKRFIQSF